MISTQEFLKIEDEVARLETVPQVCKAIDEMLRRAAKAGKRTIHVEHPAVSRRVEEMVSTLYRDAGWQVTCTQREEEDVCTTVFRLVFQEPPREKE